MKKAFLSVLLVLSVLTGRAQTTFTAGDLNYRVNDDNVSVTVIGHVDGYNAQGPLVIPESVSYDGHDYAVTVIGNTAFMYCFYLTTLTIPNSVKTIGESAFFQCEGLYGALTLGESVAYIGDWAFRKCSHISTAISLATTPATLGNELGGMVFAEFGTPVLTIPSGCTSAYQSSSWYDPYGLVGFYDFVETEITDIPEIDAEGVTLWPNPTNGAVKIEAENIQNVSIFNTLGQKVFEGTIGSDVLEYDFSDQTTGVYIVKVETAKGTVTKRVMLVK